MSIQSSCFSETRVPSCIQIGESSLQQQEDLIQSALQCLENRIHYHSDRIASPNDARNYVRLSLALSPNEIFAALFLDTQHRVLAFEKLFSGTVDNTTVYPRVMIQRALFHNAAAIIFAHNHPSGELKPSDADLRLTNELKSVLKIVDVRVLDHFIVSVKGVYSFAEHSLI